MFTIVHVKEGGGPRYVHVDKILKKDNGILTTQVEILFQEMNVAPLANKYYIEMWVIWEHDIHRETTVIDEIYYA